MPEHFEIIATHDLDANLWKGRFLRRHGIFRQERYAGIDRPHDVFGAGWTALVKIAKYIMEIVTRLRAVTIFQRKNPGSFLPGVFLVSQVFRDQKLRWARSCSRTVFWSLNS